MIVSDPALLTFGPVPSRRLGRSLGINNIPPKVCTYACVYCQVGRTSHKQTELRSFYQPEQIFEAVRQQVAAAQAAGEDIDYLTFVPDGEPTLDLHLADSIDLLRRLNMKIAVISNASLIWRDEVRRVLNQADVVSLKVDTVDTTLWHKINQPHESLELDNILQAMKTFAGEYQGELITETMLLAGLNDLPQAVSETADFLAILQPANAYLAVPTRPTCQADVSSPGEEIMVQAYGIFKEKLEHVEYLVEYEGSDFAFTGDVVRDLLAITAVHPLREEAVNAMLLKAGAGRDVIQSLLDGHQLVKVDFANKVFYMRSLPNNTKHTGR